MTASPFSRHWKVGTVTRRRRFVSTSGGCTSTVRHGCGFIWPDRRRRCYAFSFYPATHLFHIGDFPPQNAIMLPTSKMNDAKTFPSAVLSSTEKGDFSHRSIDRRERKLGTLSYIHPHEVHIPSGSRNIVHLPFPFPLPTKPSAHLESPRRLWPET